jgi:hypothetical protein
VTRWRIRKERLYDLDRKTWTHHFGWILYFGNHRIAAYGKWERCIQHIEAYYAKFGTNT